MVVKRGVILAVTLFLVLPFVSSDYLYNNFTRDQNAQAIWVWLNNVTIFNESQQQFLRHNTTDYFVSDDDLRRITVYNGSAQNAHDIQVILNFPSSLGIIRNFREEHGVPIEEPPCIERFRCKNKQILAYQKKDCKWDKDIGDITCYAGCDDGECNPTCSDTDPDSNTSFKGKVSGQAKNGDLVEQLDYCGVNSVVELNCVADLESSNNIVEEQVHGCRDCDNGVCRILTGTACIDYDSSPDYDEVSLDEVRSIDERYINSTLLLVEYDYNGTVISELMQEDSCSGNFIVERYCNASNSEKSISYLCPDGCHDGKCNPSCIDSDDNGTYNKGNVTGVLSDGTVYKLDDQCYGDFIHEKNCSKNPAGLGEVATENVYECSKGCNFGACVNDTVASILVNKPSAGLIWKPGTTRSILFEQENIKEIQIAYLIEGSAYVVAGSYPILISEKYQSYDWVIPNINVENVTVAVTGEHSDGSMITVRSENFTISNCSDSDGGKSVFTRGKVVGVPHGGYGPVQEDECVTSNILREFYLDSKCHVLEEESNCDEGCVEGACKGVDICEGCGAVCDWVECDSYGDFCEYIDGDCVTVPTANIYFNGLDLRRDLSDDNPDATLSWMFVSRIGEASRGDARTQDSISVFDDREWDYAYIDAEINGEHIMISNKISSQDFCNRLNVAQCTNQFFDVCMENPFDGSCDARTGSCTDSDGGFNPYDDSSLTSIFPVENSDSYTEYCVGDTVMEGVCDKNNMISIVPFRCPFGCSLGKCNLCDGGNCVNSLTSHDFRTCFDYGEVGCNIRDNNLIADNLCEWTPESGALPGYCSHKETCEYCGVGFFNLCGWSECASLGNYCNWIAACYETDNPEACTFERNQIEVEFLAGYTDFLDVIERVDPGLSILSVSGDTVTMGNVPSDCESDYIEILSGFLEVADARTIAGTTGDGLLSGGECQEIQPCSEGCMDMDSTSINSNYDIIDDSDLNSNFASMSANRLSYSDDCGSGIHEDILIERSCIDGSIRDSLEDCSASGLRCDHGECRENILFECSLKDSTCGSGETEVLAFEDSSGQDTNAHVGSGYRWKVCCKSTSALDVQYQLSGCSEATVITVENSLGGVDDAHVSEASFQNHLCLTAEPGIAECDVMPNCEDEWIPLFRFENSLGGVDDAHVENYGGTYANAVCCKINYE